MVVVITVAAVAAAVWLPNVVSFLDCVYRAHRLKFLMIGARSSSFAKNRGGAIPTINKGCASEEEAIAKVLTQCLWFFGE
jgi:hypothetical protein